MPKKATVENALEALEGEWGIQKPMGAAPGTAFARYQEVLEELRHRLCPRARQIKQALQSPGVDAAAVITDTIIAVVTKSPIPAAAISTKLAIVGIERFCQDPAVLVS